VELLFLKLLLLLSCMRALTGESGNNTRGVAWAWAGAGVGEEEAGDSSISLHACGAEPKTRANSREATGVVQGCTKPETGGAGG
jgi:hypothetical protein